MNSREVHELETRDTSPIQGSTLPDVILEGGVVGKVTHFLSNPIGGKPGAAAPAGAAAPKAGGPTPPQAARK